MYVGHFAIGLAVKARYPKLPALPLVLGVGFLDLVDGSLILAGANRVTANLQSGPYLFFDLTFIDWDHSLVMAVVLSLLWGAFFLQNKQLAAIAALAAFSHFVVDYPMHNHDLALFPYSESHLGFGLWGKLGVGSWLLEGVFATMLVLYAWYISVQRGVNLLWSCLLLGVLFIQLSPWLSPMLLAAKLDEPTAHLLHGALVTVGFLVPGLLLSWLITRAEKMCQVNPDGSSGAGGMK